ncbi:MAG: hypothetical protein V4704_00795 [Pseudomonadota bacterium]
MRRQHPPAWTAAAGFSLMEALVTLMLISFVSLLMFQMLGNYRIAKERVVAQSGIIDRRALFSAWFRDSIRNLYAIRDIPFRGDARRFTGVTLDPANGDIGAVTEIGWSLRPRREGGWEMRYSESGSVRWSAPLADAGRVSFGYVDGEGEIHDSWPPELGLAEGLPAAVVLRRGGRGDTRAPPLMAAVRGSLKPIVSPYELEQD